MTDLRDVPTGKVIGRVAWRQIWIFIENFSMLVSWSLRSMFYNLYCKNLTNSVLMSLSVYSLLSFLYLKVFIHFKSFFGNGLPRQGFDLGSRSWWMVSISDRVVSITGKKSVRICDIKCNIKTIKISAFGTVMLCYTILL